METVLELKSTRLHKNTFNLFTGGIKLILRLLVKNFRFVLDGLMVRPVSMHYSIMSTSCDCFEMNESEILPSLLSQAILRAFLGCFVGIRLFSMFQMIFSVA